MADGRGGYIFGGVCMIIAAVIGVFNYDLNKSSVSIEDYESLSLKYQEVLSQNEALQMQKTELASEIEELMNGIYNDGAPQSESAGENMGVPVSSDDNEPLSETAPLSTSLFKLDFFSLDGSQYYFENLTDVKDNTGTLHYDALEIPFDTEVSYLLEGRYTNISGNAFISFDYRDTSRTGTLKIYGDDTVLYSIKMSKETRPDSFSIDITGVDVLKIKYDTSIYEMLRVFLSNVILTQ